MIAAVIGSRTFNDLSLLTNVLDSFDIHKIVSGGAKGADSLSELYAIKNDINTEIFKPDWKKYGRSAGFVRNKDIVLASDIVIAFWDGVSKGTQNSISIAQKHSIKVEIIRYDRV